MATAKQIAHCRKIAASGGRARAKAFTSEYQKAARSKRRRETLVAGGRKGYVRAMSDAGFTDTIFMRANADLLDDDQPPF